MMVDGYTTHSFEESCTFYTIQGVNSALTINDITNCFGVDLISEAELVDAEKKEIWSEVNASPILR